MILDLEQEQDLEELLERSKSHPVIIFKHSTQCGISMQAYEEFTGFAAGVSDLICGVVLVIENRELSNVIAERFKVRHQSPQALLFKDGRPIWHASHWSINPDSLNEALTSYAQSAD